MFKAVLLHSSKSFSVSVSLRPAAPPGTNKPHNWGYFTLCRFIRSGYSRHRRSANNLSDAPQLFAQRSAERQTTNHSTRFVSRDHLPPFQAMNRFKIGADLPTGGANLRSVKPVLNWANV